MNHGRRVLIVQQCLLLAVLLVPVTAKDFAIRGGTILPISSNPVEAGTVLIHDGKIRAFGSDVVAPAKAQVIDAADKYVVPGFVDSQSRLYVIDRELDESRSAAPEFNILDALDPFIKYYEEVLAQGVTAVYVTGGNGSRFAGRGAILKLNGAKTTAQMVLKADVAVKAAIGISSSGQSSSLVRLDQYAQVRDALVATQDYMRTMRKYEQELKEYEKKKAEREKKGDTSQDSKDKPKRPSKPKANPTYEILAKVLDKKMPLQVEAHRTDDILNAFRLRDEFGCDLILEKCTEGYVIADEIARRKVPVIVGPVSTSFIGMPRLEYRNHSVRNAAVLADEGIQLALGVAGRDGRSSKFVTTVAAMAVANGMDRDAALRAITLTPAEILGVADRIGSLEEGKDADIVILDGHPLDSASRVETVFVDGKIVYERKTAK